jgi:hypothetical protein
LIVAAVAVAALVMASGVVAVVLVNRARVTTVTGDGTSPAGSTTTVSPSPSSPFAEPAVIGPYSRSVDQNVADAFLQALPRALQNAFAVMYEETADTSRHLLVSGGNLPVSDPVGQLNGALAAVTAAEKGSQAYDLRPADTGSVGGLAKCETVTEGTTQLVIVICGWISTQAFVEMIFYDGERDSADGLVPTILDAVVRSRR